MVIVVIVSSIVLLLVVAGVTIGLRHVMRTRRRLLEGFSQGFERGAAQDAADPSHVQRGAGGLTAAQTTAMAENLLGALGNGKHNGVAGQPMSTGEKPERRDL